MFLFTILTNGKGKTFFKRMIDLMKRRTGKPSRERHEKGMKLEVTQEDHGIFTVCSESFENKQYQIEASNPTCGVCRERCPDCLVCKCMQDICTCDDNAEGMKNICKHIHAVVGFLRNKSQIDEPKLPTEEVEKIRDVISNEETTGVQVEKYQEQIKNKILSQLLLKCNEVKDLQVLKTANSLLCKLIAPLDAGRSYLPNDNKWPVDESAVSEPSNKKVC